MLVREFQKVDFEECVGLFIDVFNQSPWNNEWTHDIAIELFNDFINTPGFVGYVAIDETTNEIVGAIIGRLKIWWRGKEYYIDEFFVETNSQGRGIGTQLLEYAYSDLRKRGIHNVTLLTNTFAPAFNFYMNKGYQESQTLRFLFKEM